MNFTEEQKKVIKIRGKNILVSAAAGSGKTAVLTERIIGRILDKKDSVDIDRILTVTFTNAAAGEMRDRIRNRLEAVYMSDPDNERLKRQLNLIHNASIMTIDAFCARVIKENFELISIDPGFRVGDENEVSILSEDACSEILSESYEEPGEDFLRFLEECSPGKEDRDAAEYIMTLSEAADARPDSEEWLRSLELPYKRAYDLRSEPEKLLNETPEPWETPIMEISNGLLNGIYRSYNALQNLCDEPDGPGIYRNIIAWERDMVSELIKTGTYEDRWDAFARLAFDKLPSKKDVSIDPEKRERAKNLRKALKDRLLKLKGDLFFRSASDALKGMAEGYTSVRELIRLTLLYRKRFAEKKEEKNILDFSDIEHLALKILKSGAADIYRDYYREVMTDEYQDSNSIQEEILKLVSNGRNYFTVGDVKQSIYSFRLAEPGIFMKRFNEYESDPDSERILLNRNFRSRHSVIDSVNQIFSVIMHSETGGVEYDENQRLNPGADYGEDGEEHRTELILLKKDDRGEIDNVEEEAACIAGRIRELTGSFKVAVREDDKLYYREVKYSDFAILLRSVSGVDERYRDILISQGIPAVIESQSGYFKTEEIRLILNLLSIIDNPRQDIPLSAVMKSSLGGFSNEELSLLRIASPEGCFYDALKSYDEEEKLKEKCASFLEFLNSYRDRLSITPLSALIRSILLSSRGLILSKGDRERGNLELLIKRASDFEKSSGRGLFKFLRYIEKVRKLDKDYGEAASGGGENAVRILSIHKSKGLEFPVVFVSNLTKQFNFSDSTADLITHKDLGLGLKSLEREKRIKKGSILRDVISVRKKLDVIGEELRIFYVALTRAKEKLIMTGVVKDADKLFDRDYPVWNAGSFLDFLMCAYKEDEENFRKYTDIYREDIESLTIKRTEEGASGIIEKKDITDPENLIETGITGNLNRNLNWVYPGLSSVNTPLKVSVSELKRREYEAPPGEGEPEAFDALPLISTESEEEKQKNKEEEQRREEAARRGTAFHKALSLIGTGYTGSDSAEDILDDLLKRGSLRQEERELINAADIASFLKTGLWERMREAERKGGLFREQPFIVGRRASEIFPGAPDDETVQVQGIIDVFFIEDGRIIVMDYKTDHVNSGETLKKRYRKQLDIYASALEQILKLKVSEKIIYSLSLNKEIRL